MSTLLPLFRASVAAALCAGAAMAQSVWLVDSGFPGPGPGTGNQVDPFRTIQAGIDAPQVAGGDTLAVAPGLYDGFDLNGKSLHVRATGPPRSVVVEFPTAPGLRVDSGEGPGARISGILVRPRPFTVSASPHGGGLIVEGSECVVDGCWFEDCVATAGGGAIAVRAGGHVTVLGSSFARNEAPRGSALFLDGDAHATVDGSTFRRNGLPGGLSLTGAVDGRDGDLVLRDSSFEDHVALEGAAAAILDDVVEDCAFEHNGLPGRTARGGALEGSGTVARSTFIGNRAGRGGAIHGTFGITDCLFAGNSAEFVGGALCGFSTARGCAFNVNVARGEGGAGAFGAYIDCRFDGNVVLSATGVGGRGGALVDATALRGRFTSNAAGPAVAGQLPSAGGAAVRSALTLCLVSGSSADRAGALADCSVDRCTVVECHSRAGGPVVESSVVASSIHWANAPMSTDAATSYGWSCVEGGAPGIGNLQQDPRFWAPFAGLYELAPDSPCIEAGDPTVTDPNGSRCDQGALPYLESFTPPTHTVCAGKVSSLGAAPVLGNGANPRIGEPWALHAQGALPGAVGLGVWSDAPATIPLAGGLICVGSANRLSPTSISASGEASFSFTPAPAVIGLRLRAQFVFRDPQHPDGTGISMTNAIEALLLP